MVCSAACISAVHTAENQTHEICQRSRSLGASRGPTVHIVDDDVAVRTGFVRLLRSAGLEVRAYPSVSYFFEQLDKAAPGCILLDITMPDLNGANVLSRLKEQENSLPAIVISARDNKAVHKFVHEIGAKMFLRKPVDDQALIDAINWVTKGNAGH